MVRSRKTFDESSGAAVVDGRRGSLRRLTGWVDLAGELEQQCCSEDQGIPMRAGPAGEHLAKNNCVLGSRAARELHSIFGSLDRYPVTTTSDLVFRIQKIIGSLSRKLHVVLVFADIDRYDSFTLSLMGQLMRNERLACVGREKEQIAPT